MAEFPGVPLALEQPMKWEAACAQTPPYLAMRTGRSSIRRRLPGALSVRMALSSRNNYREGYVHARIAPEEAPLTVDNFVRLAKPDIQRPYRPPCRSELRHAGRRHTGDGTAGPAGPSAARSICSNTTAEQSAWHCQAKTPAAHNGSSPTRPSLFLTAVHGFRPRRRNGHESS